MIVTMLARARAASLGASDGICVPSCLYCSRNAGQGRGLQEKVLSAGDGDWAGRGGGGWFFGNGGGGLGFGVGGFGLV